MVDSTLFKECKDVTMRFAVLWYWLVSSVLMKVRHISDGCSRFLTINVGYNPLAGQRLAAVSVKLNVELLTTSSVQHKFEILVFTMTKVYWDSSLVFGNHTCGGDSVSSAVMGVPILSCFVMW